MMMAAATKEEVLLIEVVVVVVEVTHRHHTLTVVLVDLSIDAIRRDARDVGIVLVADLVAHKLHHLVFDGVALCVLCQLFHVGAVLAEVFVVLLIGGASSLLIFREQPMNHRIGITADRRGEMCVIVEAEAEVPDVVRRVFGLHHGTERDALHDLSLTLPVDVVHELVDTLDHRLACAVGLHLQAERHDKLTQRLHLLGIGVVVYTIREDLGFLAFGHTSHGLCHRTVGKEHELLDELVGILGALEIAADGVSFLIDIEVELLGVELHGSVLEALLTQFLSQAVQRAQFPAILILISRLAGVRCGLAGAVDHAIVF